MSTEKPKGMYTTGADAFSPKVNSIPLKNVDTHAPGEASLGTLVSDATSQISSLVRAEVELAKAEITKSAKQGAIGGGLFAVAGVIALYSSFFFFFFAAELLAEWLPRWAAFLIVFVFMLLLAGALAFVGLQRVKKAKAPEATIESVNRLSEVVPGSSAQRRAQARANNSGMFT